MDAIDRASFLAHSQTRKFKNRVEESLSIIQQGLEIGESYVSISWGKDSIAMLHLCQQIQPDILAVHLGVDFREKFGNYGQVIDQFCQKSPTNYREVIVNEYNLKVGADTRFYLERETGSLNTFIGLRKEESRNRKIALSRYGKIHRYPSGIYRICPIADWSYLDVWAYIAVNDLPSLQFYDFLPKSSRGSRTTALEGLNLRNTSMFVEKNDTLKQFSPDFAQWIPFGDVYIPALYSLNLIKVQGVKTKRVLLDKLNEIYSADKQRQLLKYLQYNREIHPKFTELARLYGQLD